MNYRKSASAGLAVQHAYLRYGRRKAPSKCASCYVLHLYTRKALPLSRCPATTPPATHALTHTLDLTKLCPKRPIPDEGLPGRTLMITSRTTLDSQPYMATHPWH